MLIYLGCIGNFKIISSVVFIDVIFMKRWMIFVNLWINKIDFFFYLFVSNIFGNFVDIKWYKY